MGNTSSDYLTKFPEIYTNPFELNGTGVHPLDWYNYNQKTPVSSVSDEDLTRAWLSRLQLYTPEIDNYLAGIETNWADLVLHKGLQQDYTVSVTNRTDRVNYHWSLGYVDRDGNVLGWLNELAFAPVELNEEAMADEWSTERGGGCKYFSQDAVIKLAPQAGIQLDEGLTPAEKLKVIQGLMEQDDARAVAIYDSIGAYLAYTVVLYSQFYELRHLIVLGRVMSGKGGNRILERCQEILGAEYPQLAESIRVMLPDEKTRRVGQSVAAASLPELQK